MKPVVTCAVAAVIGVAGGTWLSPARRAAPPAAEEHQTVASEPAPAPTPTPEPASAAPATATVAAESLATTVVAGDSAGPTAVEREAMVRSLAAMAPTDAAAMVARLADGDAVAVLKALPITRASAILEAMSPDQAARLSRELLLAGAAP